MGARSVVGPEVWYSNDVWIRGRFSLAEEQVAELRGAALHCALPLDQIGPETFKLPTFDGMLERARDELENGSGVFQVRGMDFSCMSVDQIERVFWGLARKIGTPVSQSAAGERLYHVQNEGLGLTDKRARGPNTNRGLSFHTDRCDVIAFCCVRPAKSGGENMIASSAAVHNTIRAERPDLLEHLYRPFYWLRHNVDSGNRLPWMALPVFAPYKGKFMANIMRVLIERGHGHPDLPVLTDAQLEALDTLEAVARRPQIHARFSQKPGDMLFLNNLVVLHSRTEFHDSDEATRLILRLWLSVPNNRELDPVFAALYGTNEGNTLRGGIHPPRGD